MSIVCTEVEDSPKLKKVLYRERPGILRVTIDPKTVNQLPFPADYKFFSCFLPRKYAQWANRIQNFKVRPDDIWVVGFPKTGTTWTQNVLDQLKIKKLDFTADFVQPAGGYLESAILIEKVDGEEEIAKSVELWDKYIDELDAAPSPRMIKSHLPAYLLPKEVWSVKPKMIHTDRNAKDVAVSLFHMRGNYALTTYKGTISEFLEIFRSDFDIFTPYYEHIASYHQLRHLKHLLFLTYEEMSKDTFETVKRVSEFLECSYSDEQLQQVIEHVSFKKMREKVSLDNDPVGSRADFKFCRKGKVGGYRDEMTEDEIRFFDEWTTKKKHELNLP